MADLIPPSPSAADYAAAQSASSPLDSAQDPLALFAAWLAEAYGSEPNDPNAMTLSTVDEFGAPDARIVLLKDLDEVAYVRFASVYRQFTDINTFVAEIEKLLTNKKKEK